MTLIENLLTLHRVDTQVRALRSRVEAGERDLVQQAKLLGVLQRQEQELANKESQLAAAQRELSTLGHAKVGWIVSTVRHMLRTPQEQPIVCWLEQGACCGRQGCSVRWGVYVPPWVLVRDAALKKYAGRCRRVRYHRESTEYPSWWQYPSLPLHLLLAFAALLLLRLLPAARFCCSSVSTEYLTWNQCCL